MTSNFLIDPDIYVSFQMLKTPIGQTGIIYILVIDSGWTGWRRWSARSTAQHLQEALSWWAIMTVGTRWYIGDVHIFRLLFIFLKKVKFFTSYEK